MKHGIVWLASYPRSGATWLRAFLTNYLRDASGPATIDELAGAPVAADRAAFDLSLGYGSDELDADEIDRLRPDVFLRQAGAASKPLFRKVHDAYRHVANGRPLFPPEASLGVVYIVRNPLDVCVSMADYFWKGDRDWTVSFLSDPGACLVGDGLPKFRQIFRSWSLHASSWVEAQGHRVRVIRYEDMKQSPEECFGGVVRFLGLRDSPELLRKAIEFSEFDILKKQEVEFGYSEGPNGFGPFFRQGEIGGWRGELSQRQSAQIIARHEAAMRRFGYLDDAGKPVF